MEIFFHTSLTVLFVCLLNEPVARAQSTADTKSDKKDKKVEGAKHTTGMETEGAWFATIKDDKVSMQFKNDENENTITALLFC